MIEVPLVDLEVILRYSLAIRQESAPADELLAVLDASRALVEDMMREAGFSLPGKAQAGAARAGSQRARGPQAGREATAEMARVDVADDPASAGGEAYAPESAPAATARTARPASAEQPPEQAKPQRQVRRRAGGEPVEGDRAQPAGGAALWETDAADDDLGDLDRDEDAGWDAYGGPDQSSVGGDYDDPAPGGDYAEYADSVDGGEDAGRATTGEYAEVASSDPPARPARAARRTASPAAPEPTASDQELPTRPARARRPESRQRPLRASDG